jgi:L-cysteine S-thiosulfotransferase
MKSLMANVVYAVALCVLLSSSSPSFAQTKPTAAAPSPAPAPPAAPTSSSAPTPQQDRASIISHVQKKFPGVPVEEWSLGGATFTPGTTVTPLGGANATNTNDILAIGKRQWERKFKNGKTFANCFPNAGRRAATAYPQVEPTGAVITLELAINQCLAANDEPALAAKDALAMGAIVAYVTSLSIGQKLNVQVATPAARDRYDAGRRWFTRRLGERDLACASCHVLQAGQVVDGAGISPAVGQALSWPRVEPGGKVRTMHQQFQRCMTRVGAEPFAEGSDEFLNLQFFLATLSNGLSIRAISTTQ